MDDSIKVIYLEPKSSYISDLNSDTLWGLIISSLAYLIDEYELNSLIKDFENSTPPFLISSCFPYKLINNEIIRYYPIPIGLNIFNDQQNYYKELKKIKFIREDIFQELILGNQLDISINDFLDENNNYFLKNESKEKLNLRIMINRLNQSTQNEKGEGQIFNYYEKYISDGGLFFLFKGDIEIIKPALNLLSHFGFGGSVSFGKGYFKYRLDSDNLKLLFSDDANFFINLSLYNPYLKELEMFLSKSKFLSYEIIKKLGIIGIQNRINDKFVKEPVIFFKEGSIIPYVTKTYFGRIKEIYNFDKIKIYSYGYSFNIPFNLKIYNEF